jgi:hypothetical protein
MLKPPRSYAANTSRSARDALLMAGLRSVMPLTPVNRLVTWVSAPVATSMR